MSLVIERFLICDGECGRNYGVDFRNCSTSFIRKSAKQDGWTNEAYEKARQANDFARTARDKYESESKGTRMIFVSNYPRKKKLKV